MLFFSELCHQFFSNFFTAYFLNLKIGSRLIVALLNIHAQTLNSSSETGRKKETKEERKMERRWVGRRGEGEKKGRGGEERGGRGGDDMGGSRAVKSGEMNHRGWTLKTVHEIDQWQKMIWLSNSTYAKSLKYSTSQRQNIAWQSSET